MKHALTISVFLCCWLASVYSQPQVSATDTVHVKNFGVWTPSSTPSALFAMRTRMGYVSYWDSSYVISYQRIVLDLIPSVGYFISDSWAIGGNAEFWGFSMGNDTTFQERAQGHAFTAFVRKYWWQRKAVSIIRPYFCNFMAEVALGATNLALLPDRNVATGSLGEGLKYFWGSVTVGTRFQVSPRVYLAIDRGLVVSVNDGSVRMGWDPLRFGVEVIW